MKVEFSAFPKALGGNVAMFVAADKQLLATAETLDKESNGTLTRALSGGRFTGAKGQTLTVLGHAGASIAHHLARATCDLAGVRHVYSSLWPSTAQHF